MLNVMYSDSSDNNTRLPRGFQMEFPGSLLPKCIIISILVFKTKILNLKGVGIDHCYKGKESVAKKFCFKHIFVSYLYYTLHKYSYSIMYMHGYSSCRFIIPDISIW